ncbi:MAG: TrkH family potassium uptake protein [Treponema sp.]|nr:TrkH family potassium uptake protein [Treponema sp.]
MFAINLVRILSAIIAIVGSTMLIPIATALACNENQVIHAFVIPMVCSWIFFVIVALLFRKRKIELKIRTTFVVVACAWISISLFGMIPLYAGGYIESFTDAVFESVSGFSTTGCTILSDVESLPRSVNLWRCQTHWLGGMGIVALTVALLPLLGVGGFQLIKAETTGPEKGKVTAKITTTAKILWMIYFVMTVIEAVLLKICGMDAVDSIMHAFSTLGTGGFSSLNASIGGFNSSAINIVITVFMVLAGINFSLYYYAFTGKFNEIRENSEFKAYIGFFIVSVLVIAAFIHPVYGTFFKALEVSGFQVAAIITTTGFGTADYTEWPMAAQFFIFLLFFTGGCSGSTAGGIKVVRWVILCKQVNNETKKMLHPHGVFSIRLNNNPGRKDVVFNVAAFMVVYMALIMVTTFVGCLGNLDILTSFTAAFSMVGNVGPAFGRLGPSFNYGFLPDFVKWWYCFAMLAGRLELYTMIIFFMPVYWKK